MAKKPEPATADHEDSLLMNAATAVGTAAGKAASLGKVTAGPDITATPSKRTGKLLKKNKSRLPRRQKKAQQKASAQ
jgi:hypothetical protein